MTGLVRSLCQALQAGDEFFGEGFAGFGPEKAAADVAVLLNQQGEGEEFFDVLLDAGGGVLVEVFVFEDPGGVEAEVDADVAVLFVAGGVEGGAEAGDADGGRFEAPGGVEAGGRLGVPEHPAHFELVGAVVVELLGGFGDGVFDDGAFGVGSFGGTLVVDVDALVDGGLGPVDGVDGGGGDAAEVGGGFAVFRDDGELAQDAGERGGQGFKAEVREP